MLDSISETIETTAPETTAPAETTRAKRTSEINVEHGTVTFEGVVRHMSELPVGVTQHMALVGIRHTLSQADDAAKRWDEIKAGNVSVRVPAKAKPLDPMRKAIAHAVAEAKAKEAGHKAKSPEAAMVLDDCLQLVVSLTKEQVKKRSKHLAVMTHYARIVGDASAPAAALLG